MAITARIREAGRILIKGERPKPQVREIGAPGGVFSNRGWLQSDDFNLDWKDLKRRVKKIEEMRRTDGQVIAMLLACKLPMLASKWIIRPPEKPTAEEEMHAKFVEENLYGMTNPWVETLSQVLTYLDFGFSVFEKVFKVGDDGRFHWKKWAVRHQSSIERWNTNPDGGLRSVVQNVWKDGRFQRIPLGINRLMIFTNAKEGGNWEGQSVLRPAYKHFFFKDRLYRIDGIAHERHGVGVPVVKMPPGHQDAEWDVAEQILKDLRSHEKGYVVLPFGFELEILEIKGQHRNPMDSIKHHDEKISSAVLANFLNLGFSVSGSRNIGDAQASFFLNSLNTYTSYIAGIVNRHAVRELIEVNFGQQERYPELAAVPIGGLDTEKLSRSMMMLTQVGLVDQDERVVEHMHTLLGLPRPTFENGLPQGGVQEGRGPKPRDRDNGKVSNTDDDDDDNENSEAREKVAAYLRPIVDLQIDSLIASANNGGKGRFRPPLEGTLTQALRVKSMAGTSAETIERASREFSRRLASAAELGYSSSEGSSEVVEKFVVAEAQRSLGVLLDTVPSLKETADAV